jgi:pyroglutamyl-peptidase
MLESILVTGFGPFGMHGRNSSEEAVKALDGLEVEGFVLRALLLPMQLERAVALLDDAIESDRPAAVLQCGIHDEAAGLFRLELAARNERQYTIPDIDGNLIQGQPVEPGAPAMVFSTLPVGAIKLTLDEAGVPTELSEDAGRFVDNAVFFWLARRVAHAGFLRVPPAHDRQGDVTRAVRLAAEVTARRLAAQRVEATA